jgi:hypothetical protein
MIGLQKEVANVILFRMVTWMEEKKRLDAIIKETEGDTPNLIKRKETVENRMRRQADNWQNLRTAALQGQPE